MSSHSRQTRAYLELKREVEDLLYEVDPDGWGSSIAAPRDEYSDVAARVIPLLIEAADGAEVELPWPDADLRARLTAVAARYR